MNLLTQWKIQCMVLYLIQQWRNFGRNVIQSCSQKMLSISVVQQQSFRSETFPTNFTAESLSLWLVFLLVYYQLCWTTESLRASFACHCQHSYLSSFVCSFTTITGTTSSSSFFSSFFLHL